MRTEEDVIDLWERTSDDYGSEFGDEYPLGEAIQHFRGHGYDFVLAQIVAIKDDIETERYHEICWLRKRSRTLLILRRISKCF